MSLSISHWGFHTESGCEGSYEACPTQATRPEVGMVLTEAGEVLINRNCKANPCCVAIVISRSATGLSRPQSERLLRAWDVALAIANGNSEAVHLQPMPHHWRFSRSDYLTIDEWQDAHRLSEPRPVHRPDRRQAGA